MRKEERGKFGTLVGRERRKGKIGIGEKWIGKEGTSKLGWERCGWEKEERKR